MDQRVRGHNRIEKIRKNSVDNVFINFLDGIARHMCTYVLTLSEVRH